MTNGQANQWTIALPIERAPFITGCRDTHVLATNGKGERYFVPREWVAQ